MDEEAFDVDAFCETLFAYMPSTEVIPPIEITVRKIECEHFLQKSGTSAL